LHAEERTLEGMEVAIQAGMVVTLVAKEDIMEVIPATRIGRITSGTTARGHFINQHPCPSTDKTLADCPQLGELQTIPAEKANNRFE
jgi:hypothetical protein